MPCHRCCSSGSCRYFFDGFMRDNSSVLGDHWTEVAGDWRIESNTLVTGSASAICTCSAEHPDEENTLVVVTSVHGRINNGKWRVIVDYVDTDNYWYVEVALGDGGGVRDTIKMYSRVAGVETEKHDAFLDRVVRPGQFIEVQICVTTANIAVNTSHSMGFNSPMTPSSDTVGVGTIAGSEGDVSFGDFAIYKSDPADSTCPRCGACMNCSNDQANFEYLVTVPAGIIIPQVTCAAAIEGDHVVSFHANAFDWCEWRNTALAAPYDRMQLVMGYTERNVDIYIVMAASGVIRFRTTRPPDPDDPTGWGRMDCLFAEDNGTIELPFWWQSSEMACKWQGNTPLTLSII